MGYVHYSLSALSRATGRRFETAVELFKQVTALSENFFTNVPSYVGRRGMIRSEMVDLQTIAITSDMRYFQTS